MVRSPFAEGVASSRVLGARLQIPRLLDEHVERAATPILFRFRTVAVLGAAFPIAFLLRRVRRHEFQTDDYLTLVSNRIVERLRLRERLLRDNDSRASSLRATWIEFRIMEIHGDCESGFEVLALEVSRWWNDLVISKFSSFLSLSLSSEKRTLSYLTSQLSILIFVRYCKIIIIF